MIRILCLSRIIFDIQVSNVHHIIRDENSRAFIYFLLGVRIIVDIQVSNVHHIIRNENSTVGRSFTSFLGFHLLEVNSCKKPCRACHIPGEFLISLFNGQSKPFRTWPKEWHHPMSIGMVGLQGLNVLRQRWSAGREKRKQHSLNYGPWLMPGTRKLWPEVQCKSTPSRNTTQQTFFSSCIAHFIVWY